ncbi:unnamed protein product [Paramecium sonneborni]|uniref:Uncharacterized protein n=1 Tax=Paramecium sonneborni TaxID=65129 RepID=A0A8S1LC33_9CILI|nr:unnamed protein product [Paramecium sonneborni]
MKQKRYDSLQDEDEFAVFQYHDLSSIAKNQKSSLNDSRFSQFYYKNDKDQNQQLRQLNTYKIERADSLKNLKRQNQLYQISLKFKKIINEDFIQNQKVVIFKDRDNKECTCVIGNQVEYPKFINNEVYNLFGVELKGSSSKDNTFQITIQKGKITTDPIEEQGSYLEQFQKEQQNNQQEQNFQNLNQPIYQIQQNESPSLKQNLDIKTYFNILVSIVQQFEKNQVWSSKCSKHFNSIKVEVMDQDGQLSSITLWNQFLEHKFNPYQIVFFQNLELKSLQSGTKYLQTIDGVSKIITEDAKLQLLSNYDEVKLAADKKQENEQFRKLITYQEIQQQDPF